MKSINPRRAVIGINYNGKNVETSLAPYLETFSYVDVASGEGDTISIQLDNIEKKWLNEWLPVKGDQLVAQIKTYEWDEYKDNWDKDNGMEIFKCGTFILDDFTFSGRPLICTINGISTPCNTSFKTTKRTKTWEDVTIKAVGEEFAKRAGILLVYDAEQIPIKTLEQSGQTDAECLINLCKEYGLYLKIYANKVIIYNPVKYDEQDVVMVIDEKDMKSWDWKTTTEGTYTGGKMEYTDASSEEDYTCQIGAGNRILDVSGKADSKEDARKKVIAAVNLANRGMTTMTVNMMGTFKIAASSCVEIIGLGKLNGKYFVDKVTHSVGKGYTLQLDLSKVEEKIN